MRTLSPGIMLLALMACASSVLAGTEPPESAPLWNTAPPGVVAGAGPGVEDSTGRIRNIGIPGMSIYLPKGPGTSRRAIILCPGGAYTHLAGVKTGNGALEPFLAQDVAVIVLRYRVKPPAVDVEADALVDAKRAVRIIRHRAGELGVDPRAIGMAGWSAGGNLALNLATHFDNGNPDAVDPVERESCRPDFVALLCPWPDGRTIENYPVARNAPPAFIASARDDKTAPTAFAEAIAGEYAEAGVPHKFWQIDAGGHGAFSEGSTGEGARWQTLFMQWLQSGH